MLQIFKHDCRKVTELIRELKLGGDTFYRHKDTLVKAGLIRQISDKNSKIHTVRFELTYVGFRVAILLDQLSDTIEELENMMIMSQEQLANVPALSVESRLKI